MSAADELRSLSKKELEARLLEDRKELFGLRMSRSGEQLSDFSRFRKVRKDIARIKTVLHEGSIKQAADASAESAG